MGLRNNNDHPATIPEDEPLQLLPVDTTNNSSMLPITGLPNTEGFVVHSRRSWLIKVGPVKKHMFKGHLIRTVRGVVSLGSKRRKISVEVQAPPINDTGGPDGVLLGSLFGAKKEEQNSAASASQTGALEKLEDHEVVWVKIFKKNKHADDETSIATDSETVTVAGGAQHDESEEHEYCKETDTYQLADLEILGEKGKALECKIGSGNETVVRDFKFHTLEEAEAFSRVCAKLNKMATERTQRQLSNFRASPSSKESAIQTLQDTMNTAASDGQRVTPMDATEGGIAVLCEIVSAQNVPVADIYSTDPYVIVRVGKSEIHRTAVISKDLDPIWTVQTGSLFLLEMDPEEFFKSSSMNFVIKDYDQFGANEIVGSVHVPLQDVLSGTGERQEYPIVPKKEFQTSRGQDLKPRLFLRFRPATADDISFMKNLEGNHKAVGAYVDETVLRYRVPEMRLLKRRTKKGDNKEVLHRVMPFPDPEHIEETKWMTKEQIYEDSMKPSKNWVEVGSGDLGKLYIEVLRCEGLPNMDSLTLDVRDATDAFACIVFEDAIACTDVISNTLSPRWPSWSQRAFVFHVVHPSSDLMLGLFDFDPENSPLQLASRATSSLHDPIGRVQVNLSLLRQNTDYTLCYPLHFGESAADMDKPNGKIWIRLRKEWADVRQALFKSALPPNPPIFVTVARPIDFQLAHYTTEGPHAATDFSLAAFTLYIQELQSYKELSTTITEALMTVWLWRGHFPVKFRGQEILLPLHSMTAYLWAITITRNFNTFPAFLFFLVGWILVATNEQANSNPSVWHRTPSFLDGLRLLLNTRWTDARIEIPPDYNKEAVEAYNKAKADRVARKKRELELDLKYDESTRKRLGVIIEDAQAEDEGIITSYAGNLYTKMKELANPMTLTVKPVLHPIQMKLRYLVITSRIVKSVILWEEFYYSFWLTLACFSVSFILIWIPWDFLFRWLFRIVAWVGLGPWMMIIDKKYFAENPDLTDEERDEMIRKRVEARYEAVIHAATQYQIRKERIIKLKSMSRYMFGRFNLRVPHFNEDLYSIVPLPESYAKPHDPSSAPPIRVVDHKYGQHLEGDMIPKRDIQIEAEVGGKKEKKNRLNKHVKALGFLRNNAVGSRIADGLEEGIHILDETVPLLGHKDDAMASKSKVE